jgi:hypothetical protein
MGNTLAEIVQCHMLFAVDGMSGMFVPSGATLEESSRRAQCLHGGEVLKTHETLCSNSIRRLTSTVRHIFTVALATNKLNFNSNKILTMATVSLTPAVLAYAPPHPEQKEFTPPRDRAFFADPTKASLLSQASAVEDVTPYIGTELKRAQLSRFTDAQRDELALLVAEVRDCLIWH